VFAFLAYSLCVASVLVTPSISLLYRLWSSCKNQSSYFGGKKVLWISIAAMADDIEMHETLMSESSNSSVVMTENSSVEDLSEKKPLGSKPTRGNPLDVEGQEPVFEDTAEDGEDDFSGGIQLDPAPEGSPRGRIPETAFAGDYRSVFINVAPPPLSNKDLHCLGHVNCSYLSTTGRAPTLLELKRHAQSLVILIKHLTVSTKGGYIDSANLTKRNDPTLDPDQLAEFHQNESFDFLNNLSERYENDDRHHHMPLTGLINTLEPNVLLSEAETGHPTPEWPKFRNICPLHRPLEEPPPYGHSQPYATHEALISHANEILEYLDHEYSAKGGLLGIFPQKQDKEDRKKAEATLLGQFILYTQRLVQRLHDLERLYANALDVMAGEASAPHQYLSRLGPQGRKPRDMVYPQDRFILVNAGDDVYSWLQTEFDAREVSDEKLDEKYRQLGLTGNALYSQIGGKEYTRGITAIDVVTRYYRLRKDPLKTIFLIPAYQNHPGTKVTREFEPQPTVVSVVKPLWPERISMWEQRHRDALAAGQKAQMENMQLREKSEHDDRNIEHLRYDNQLQRAKVRALEKLYSDAEAKDGVQPDEGRAKTFVDQAESLELYKQNQALHTQLDREKEELAAKQVEADRIVTEANAHKSLVDARIASDLEKLEEAVNKIQDRDMETARAQDQLEGKLKKVWTKQIEEMEVLLNYLRSQEALVRIGGNKISEGPVAEEAALMAEKKAKELVDKAADPMVGLDDI